MTTEISGKVEDTNGNAISGATVYLIRESDDSIVDVVTTDSAGEYQITGLSSTETYHVGAQYDDGSTKYNGESYPLVEPFTDTGPIDDFEDADIVEYTGDKISYETQNSIVFEGTTALKMGNDDGSGHSIFSTSGLDRYPSSGDSFSFRTLIEDSDNVTAMFFGVQDSDNYYRARINAAAGEISVGKRVSGSLNSLEFASASIPTNEWLEGIIEWTADNEITFTLNDASGTEIASTPQTVDTEFVSGGIGWYGFSEAFSGNPNYYDIAELTTVGVGADIVIDSFEDNDLSEYTGDTGSVTLQSTTVKDGSIAATLSEGGTDILSTAGSGLNQYPAQGDIFRFNHHFPSGAVPRFYFGVQDSSNYYAVELDSVDGQFIVYKANGGSESVLDSVSASYTFNAWVETEVEWRNNGRMIVTHFDDAGSQVAQVDVWEPDYTSGGVGWGEYSALATASVGTIDDFEDNDISEYSGDTGNFTTVTSPTTSGSYSLEADEGSTTNSLDKIEALIYSTSIANTPARGYEFKWDFRFGTTGTRASMLFCVQDANNFYYAGADNGQELWVKKVSGGSVTKSTVGSASSGSYDPDTWYTATVQIQSGGGITYNDSNGGSSLISITDSEYDDGGVGWGVNGGPGYFDNARVTQEL